jgi:hypothetical protein
VIRRGWGEISSPRNYTMDPVSVTPAPHGSGLDEIPRFWAHDERRAAHRILYMPKDVHLVMGTSSSQPVPDSLQSTPVSPDAGAREMRRYRE